MKHLNHSVVDVIGNTPIVRLNKVSTHINPNIYAKLEYTNPGGSIKDRIGTYMIKKAIERGELKPGGTIIEGTSGNTGVGLAMYAAIHGYKCIFVLPDKQSIEKIQNLRAFGAKVIVTPTNVEPDDPRSYYSVARRLSETTPNSYYVNQYDNLDNRETHYMTTGPEIWEQTKGEFDVLVAGIGTCGTITGLGMYLKEKNPNIKIVGVDTEGSILGPFFHTGEVVEARPYKIEGIGEDIFPKNLDYSVIDDIIEVSDKESMLMTRALLTKEGLYCGGSSGSAVVGAMKYSQKVGGNPRILVIIPDSGNRYTGKIFNDDWMRENGFWDSSFNVSIREVLTTLDKQVSHSLISLKDDASVGNAIDLMKSTTFPQVPVYRGDELVGVVHENKLLRPLFEHQISLSDNISIGMDNNFIKVHIDELLETVANNLLKKNTVIVEEDNKFIAILTDIDVLNYMSHGKSF